MLDHIGLKTGALKELVSFYEATLAPLGIAKLKDYGVAAGFGRGEEVPFWIGQGDGASAVHLAFTAPDRAGVDAFYQAALAAGARDNGAPGLRAQYHPNYYGAFVLDPDGNNIEAVCHRPE
jgi:catechol 2,3-dioxygenase-like lactoylglutathione lyase family enzyme